MSAIGRLWSWLRDERYGDYIFVSTGERFYPLDPRIGDIDYRDIAIGLANSCRYTGQLTRGSRYLSVAEHSVLVSRVMGLHARIAGLSPEFVLARRRIGLLHDGTEAYIRDIPAPLKRSRELRGYRRIEARLQRVIYEAHGLWPEADDLEALHHIDTRIRVDECRAMRDDSVGYGRPVLDGTDWSIQGMLPANAERLFLDEYKELFW